MYEEPSTRKTWSPFFGGRAWEAGAPGVLPVTLGFAAGMGAMWAVHPPLATPDRQGHPCGGAGEGTRPADQNLIMSLRVSVTWSVMMAGPPLYKCQAAYCSM